MYNFVYTVGDESVSDVIVSITGSETIRKVVFLINVRQGWL